MKCKTGDVCPVSGIWLLEESGEEMAVLKGDVFPSFEQERAHFCLIKPFKKEVK